MGIETVAHPPYSSDVAPCDFWLFPKLTGCRYETIEEMKEAVTKVIDTLTQEDFMGHFRSCWNGTTSALKAEQIHVCTINKSAYTKKSGNLFNDPRILIWLFRVGNRRYDKYTSDILSPYWWGVSELRQVVMAATYR